MDNVESNVINAETVLKKTVNMDKGGFDYNWDYHLYTDGSKSKYSVGAGLCYMRDNEVLVRESIGLSTKTITFPAELRATQLAWEVLSAHHIFGNFSKPIELIIFSNSLSSLQALALTEIKKTSAIKKTHDLLNNLGC